MGGVSVPESKDRKNCSLGFRGLVTYPGFRLTVGFRARMAAFPSAALREDAAKDSMSQHHQVLKPKTRNSERILAEILVEAVEVLLLPGKIDGPKLPKP